MALPYSIKFLSLTYHSLIWLYTLSISKSAPDISTSSLANIPTDPYTAGKKSTYLVLIVEWLSWDGIRIANILDTTSGIDLSVFSIKSITDLKWAGIIISVYLSPVSLPLLSYALTPALKRSCITTNPPFGILTSDQLGSASESNPFVASSKEGLVFILFQTLSLIISERSGIPLLSKLYTFLYTPTPKSETNAKEWPGIFSANTPLLKYVKNNPSNLFTVIGLFKSYCCSPFTVLKNSNKLLLDSDAFNPACAYLKNAVRLGVILFFLPDIFNSSIKPTVPSSAVNV